jgi:hypothetical protein
MTRFFSPLALTAVLFATTPAFANHNPAVQPIFFEQLQNVLPADEPAALAQDGAVTEVTLSGLAWAIDNVKNDHVPLVIEFYSSDQSMCAVLPQSGISECLLQMSATPLAAANYQGRVKFLRIDVSKYSSLLNGPDVRVLPSHIVIADYSDTTHYTAIKVGGYLSMPGLQSLVKEILSIEP